MTSQQINDIAEHWAENSVLKLLGRGFMAFFVPLMSGAIVWMGATLWDINYRQAMMEGKIDLLTDRIERGLSDYYQASDALRDLKLRDFKDKEQDRRIERLENTLNTLKGGP